jgi:hypothetical protein
MPQWVQNGKAPDAYPSALYVIGIGSGNDARSAAVSARGEIARTFHAHVRHEIADRQKSSSVQGRETTEQDIEARTRIETNVVLQGARIAETWRDPGSDIRWALAVLDRVQERARIQRLYERQTQLLTSALTDAARSAHPEHELGAMMRAADAARALDEPTAGLVMLGSSNLTLDSSIPSLAALEVRMADLRKQLPVQVGASEIDLASGRPLGDFEPLRVELSEAVTDMGFPISRGDAASAPPWLRVRSHLGVAPQPELSKEFFVYRWEGGFELVRIRDGRSEVVAVVNEHGRITHSLDRRARLHAQREAQKVLAESLRAWLVDLSMASD